MLEFIDCKTHYCVHNAANIWIGTIKCYLGKWLFEPRTPIGHIEPYKLSAEEMRQLSSFIDQRATLTK